MMIRSKRFPDHYYVYDMDLEEYELWEYNRLYFIEELDNLFYRLATKFEVEYYNLERNIKDPDDIFTVDLLVLPWYTN